MDSADHYLTEDELIKRALQALMDALGPIETMRFLTLPRTQRIESVKRHHQWQATLDQEQFLEQVFGQMRQQLDYEESSSRDFPIAPAFIT